MVCTGTPFDETVAQKDNDRVDVCAALAYYVTMTTMDAITDKALAMTNANSLSYTVSSGCGMVAAAMCGFATWAQQAFPRCCVRVSATKVYSAVTLRVCM